MIAVILFFSACAISLLLTPILRDVFIRQKWVDLPDNVRKLHSRPIPRSGGIVVMLSCALVLLAGYLLRPSGVVFYIQHRVLLTAVLPATLVIFLVGIADDLVNLRPRYKLLGQCAAALFTVLMGARLNLPHLPVWLSIAVSLLWLLACTNAINLIDGMDGLAGGVSLLALLTTLGVAVLHHNAGLLLATAPLAGALLGFLRYNFAPASVFLGDAGSLTIGFLLGCLAMVWSASSGDGINLLGPLIALALPLVDVLLAIFRRYLRGVPIFRADRGHIHHRVLALGFSPRNATLILYGCCLIFALLALLQSIDQRHFDLMVLALFVLIVLFGVHRLRYVEFSALRQMLQRGTFRTILLEEIHLQEIRSELAAAMTPEDCWKAIRPMCENAQVSQLTLQLVGCEFRYRNDRLEGEAIYSMHLPLGEESSLFLTSPVRKTSGMLNRNIYQIQCLLQEKVLVLSGKPALTQKKVA